MIRARPAPTFLAATLACIAPARAGDAFEGMAGPYGERLRYDEKGLSLTFPEPDVSLQIGGRLHIDAGGALFSRPGLPEAFPDHVAVRRSWIEPTLTIGRDWLIAFQYDFSDPVLPINDAFVAWKGLPDTIVTLGNMKVPLSLEWLQSNNDTLFVERSGANALVPERRFGVAVGRNGQAWTAVAGVFANAASNGIAGDGVAVGGRATVAPILEERETLHLGLAVIDRRRSRSDGAFSFSAPAGSALFERQLVDTGDLPDAARVTRLGAEFAYRRGPFLLQAEYIRAALQPFAGPGMATSVLGFQGGYVEAAWVLNGEGRGYTRAPQGGTTYATFKGVAVAEGQRVSRGGTGVFELAARYSAIDLDTRGFRGGLEQDVTLGLSWYPEPNLRLIANYVHGRVRPGDAQSETYGTAPFSVDTIIGRLQIYW
ncbi:phosphate-selective porin OprO and OprP [Methylobacterium phyllostachyos]|uniref:Phosphate-selective porin OprO and OprP n=1 Tax=Methylobacterium phyllostachyos TaxID=582672 RepID=A0A1H0AL55_9HYPH|nr:porin [Methylobacterium phyllostachyos]SDN34197.1 phosphate-selective porin OprO and OprP [Methylobacterium phyllostachyos]